MAEISLSSYNILSWEKSLKRLFCLQSHLFKLVFVKNFSKALRVQKLMLRSNFMRLLAIREVTQVSYYKSIPGIDGKLTLTFLERMELNEFLKNNFNNWKPSLFRKVITKTKKGLSKIFSIPTIKDRVWQSLIKFILEPAHEALFHPHNFGFRSSYSVYNLQKIVLLQISESSFGFQKRILKVNLKKVFLEVNKTFLLRRLFCPRSIRLSIFRFFRSGLLLKFSENVFCPVDLSIILSNVSVDNLESIHTSVRCGYDILFFLKPHHNESDILNKVTCSLNSVCLKDIEHSLEFRLFSTSSGFDFLGWHFKVFKNGNCSSFPSFESYQVFLKRIKHIINNSNYGAVCLYQ